MFTTPITTTDELHKQVCDLLSRTIKGYLDIRIFTEDENEKFKRECDELTSQGATEDMLESLKAFFDEDACLFVRDAQSVKEFIDKLNNQYLISQENEGAMCKDDEDQFSFDEEEGDDSVRKVKLFAGNTSIIIECSDHKKFKGFPIAVQECLKKYIDYVLTKPLPMQQPLQELATHKSPSVPIRAKSFGREGNLSAQGTPMANTYGHKFRQNGSEQGRSSKPELSGKDLMQQFSKARQFTK